MSKNPSVERLDELITRLERAGEQLRSGELSADAAATMVEDCAALATQAAAELEQLTRAEELDAVIDRHAHGWSVQRIQPLERSIMRVALIEMLHPDAAPAEQPIPPEGAIEEAVESAKTFCGADAPAFVNGVLGAVLREVRENARIR